MEKNMISHQICIHEYVWASLMSDQVVGLSI